MMASLGSGNIKEEARDRPVRADTPPLTSPPAKTPSAETAPAPALSLPATTSPRQPQPSPSPPGRPSQTLVVQHPMHYLSPDCLGRFADLTIISTDPDQSSDDQGEPRRPPPPPRLSLPRALLAAWSPRWKSILEEAAATATSEEVAIYVPLPPAHLSALGHFLSSGLLPLPPAPAPAPDDQNGPKAPKSEADLFDSVYAFLGIRPEALSTERVETKLLSAKSVLEVDPIASAVSAPASASALPSVSASSLARKPSRLKRATAVVVAPDNDDDDERPLKRPKRKCRKAQPNYVQEVLVDQPGLSVKSERVDESVDATLVVKTETLAEDDTAGENDDPLLAEPDSFVDEDDGDDDGDDDDDDDDTELELAPNEKEPGRGNFKSQEERDKYYFPTGPRDESKKLQCDICSYGTNEDRNMHQHQLRHRRTNKNHNFFCRICEQGFQKRSGLSEHARVHKGKPLVCDKCGKEYASSAVTKYRKHMAEHNDPDVRTCVQCGKEYISRLGIRRHQKFCGKYHGNQCMQCTDSTVTFASWKEHKKHLESAHDGEFRYVCGLCPKTFALSEMVLSHRRTDHKPEEKPFKDRPPKVCDTCGKVVNAAYLKLHMEQEHGTERVECEFCNRVVKSKHVLRIHIKKMHQKFPCDICGKLQRTKYDYRLHMNTMHVPDGKKPYQCRFCHRGFGQAFSLREHERIHTNERPFKCPEPGCDSAFNSASNLRSHDNMVHKGIKRVHKCRLEKKKAKEEAAALALALKQEQEQG